ncbi:DUF397 domain-containing protein [Streptomyces sp. SLBN-31]|jgi:hypothetical protein|uniref:DUF397 domain-containing protein n=1 Tax=Streptomyces sp. SLBN-31 TaxID=2768444 RepID=UPI001154CF4E|nr:DUF397 domain-containing protein [Streptomyces sp. SLBN-31]TQJ74790.1 uncharacterized protein DUF397 [Streptomyces sp. SLBN-31]
MSRNLVWFKSSYSGSEGECLEIALTPTTIHIRDSKSPESRPLQVARLTWTEFLGSLPPATRG